MLEFFKNVITFLNYRNIPYMLSGSVALSIYIVPRATRDIDIVVEFSPDDVNKFVEHFSKLYYCDRDSILDALKRKSMFNIIDGKSGFKADFIILKTKRYHQNAFERRRITEFLNIPVYVVSPEDLVLAKIIWIQELQSAQQITDITNLLEITTLDKEYILYWIKELDLITFGLPL
ncbi:MAG: hypothetical protein M3Y85_06345 [Bacteroidota bacterium]|nr:hypothetical protein [Bacteroidota bacterium]